MNGYALAMLVLCIATVLQIIVNARWSYRNRQECAQDRADLVRLRVQLRERLAKLSSTAEAMGLTRDLLELGSLIGRVESELGLTILQPANWREATEPAPDTSKSPGLMLNAKPPG